MIMQYQGDFSSWILRTIIPDIDMLQEENMKLHMKFSEKRWEIPIEIPVYLSMKSNSDVLFNETSLEEGN